MQQERLYKLGLAVPRLLLPREDIDISTWAVIACDQHTSDESYWHEVERIANGSPSTLHMILPEAYLNAPDREERISAIHRSMQKFSSDGTLVDHGETGVLVRRELPESGTRWGMVLAVDLEAYNYDPDARTPIRATEATIVERIPPRVAIRKGAPLELPHILMLLDDPDRTVIEPLAERSEGLHQLYDGELMLGGGRITGFALDDEETITRTTERLEALMSPERLRGRYGSSDPFVVAVGDGNHSLAAAKTVWEELKAAGADPSSHPARYALVEIVNLYDEGLQFEPIHRVVFGVNRERFIARLQKELAAQRTPVRADESSSHHAKPAARLMDSVSGVSEKRFIGLLAGRSSSLLECQAEGAELPGVLLQRLLDEYTQSADGENLEIDYVHDLDTVAQLCEEPDNIGIILPPMDRTRLFPWVVNRGPLPRKIFSMGKSAEKRYYLEARRINASPPADGATSAEEIASEEQEEQHDKARG